MSKILKICNDSIVGLSAAKISIADNYESESSLDLILNQYPWNFKDSSFEKIEIQHALEFIDCAKSFMEELYRVLEVDGNLKLTSYYFNSIKQHVFLNQKRQISEYTFLPFNRNWRIENKITDQINCNFEFSYGYDVSQEWSLRSDEAKNFAIKHYNNVPEKLIVNLIKKI